MNGKLVRDPKSVVMFKSLFRKLQLNQY